MCVFSLPLPHAFLKSVSMKATKNSFMIFEKTIKKAINSLNTFSEHFKLVYIEKYAIQFFPTMEKYGKL